MVESFMLTCRLTRTGIVSGWIGEQEVGSPGTEDLARNAKNRSPHDLLSFAAGHPPEGQ
jgi:hypothetical protein